MSIIKYNGFLLEKTITGIRSKRPTVLNDLSFPKKFEPGKLAFEAIEIVGLINTDICYGDMTRRTLSGNKTSQLINIKFFETPGKRILTFQEASEDGNAVRGEFKFFTYPLGSNLTELGDEWFGRYFPLGKNWCSCSLSTSVVTIDMVDPAVIDQRFEELERLNSFSPQKRS